MRPVKTSECDVTYLGPAEGIGDLPCYRKVIDGFPAVCSIWEPDSEEYALLLGGGRIEIAIIGEPIPPISLIVVPGDLSNEDANG